MEYIRNCKGFTLVELLISIAMACIVLAWVSLCMSNMYWTQEGVLKELQTEHPNTTKILKTERNYFGYSWFKVQVGDHTDEYLLDTNLMGNYTFHKK